MKKLLKDNRGSSLVELIIYITVSSIILVELTGIVSQVIFSQIKVEAISREDENARIAMRLLSQTVLEAQTITAPYGPNSTGSSMNITDRTGNVIVYSLTNGIIYKTVNSGTAVQITSNDVYVKALTFTVESEAGIAPSINIKIDIQQTQTNASNLAHYETTSAQREL